MTSARFCAPRRREETELRPSCCLDLVGKPMFVRDWKMKLYWHLPVRLQEAALSVYARHLDGLYYGLEFETWRQHFESWKNWSAADIEAWQHRQLAEIVELAGSRIPYYKEAWRDSAWKRDRCSGDLRLLPLLDRQSIRRNERAFLVEGLDPKSLWVEKTSGTTGTSLRIYWPKEMLPQFYALTEVMIRNPAGVGQGIPRAMMGGRPIVRGDAAGPPYWRFNRRWRQLYLSSYHVSRKSAPGYVEALRQYGSEWMTGYGSAIAALAESALEAGVAPHPLRAVIVSGDTLLPAMRSSIERFFQCRCFDSYGQSEGVATTMECAFGRKHVLPASWNCRDPAGGRLPVCSGRGGRDRGDRASEPCHAPDSLSHGGPRGVGRRSVVRMWGPRPYRRVPRGARGRLPGGDGRPADRAALDGGQAKPEHPFRPDRAGSSRPRVSSRPAGTGVPPR